MNVTLLTSTDCENVLEFIGEIAGICYGHEGNNAKRAISCWRNGHESVFEHFVATWKIEGISRACSHQLVRHRLASYTQASQRYQIVPDKDWYTKPDAFCAGDVDPIFWMESDEFFYACMGDAMRNYHEALKAGIKPEDARYLLPQATKTDLVVSMNLRGFLHFYELRSSNRAQAEIRELAQEMMSTLTNVYPEIKNL